MAWIPAAIIAGSNLVGGYLSGQGAKAGAQTQADAARRSAELQKQMFDIQNAQQAPYRQSGYNALNQIGRLGSGTYGIYGPTGDVTGQGVGTGYLTKQFSPEDFQAGIDPGYAFRLAQGQRALAAQQNAAGGLIGGNALTGMQDYTQGQASQEYGNAFNRFQTQRGNIYNTLASMAGLGQTSLGQTTAASTNAGANIGNQISNVGSALGAGQVGQANAYAGAVQGAGNSYMLSQLLAPKSGNARYPLFDANGNPTS
jgi:hypothetical protein